VKIETDSKPFSSWLVDKWTIGIFVAILIYALIYGRTLLFSFVLLIIFISLTSLFWSRYALYKIKINAVTTTSRIFAGESIVIKYSIKNEKFLPLIWVKWIQALSSKQALIPIDEEEWLCRDVLYKEKEYFYTKQLSWVLWFHEINWESTWVAQRRGVYTSDSILILSGDGFGLCDIERKQALSNTIKIIIYPTLIPVDLYMLLRQSWGTDAGSFGVIEDKSLIKGTRDFQNGDSWKYINWRLAAKHGPLQVNIFQKVKFPSMHFIVDTKSFQRSSNAVEDFEDALSILASVIVELSEKHIAVGISTPSQSDYSMMHIFPETCEENNLDILEVLAHLSFETSKNIFIEMDNLRLYDSLEEIYTVSYDNNYFTDKNGVIEELNGKLKAVINYQSEDSNYSERMLEGNFDIIPMNALKRR
jgi:uncharacterized protein (DUF58 family)